MPKKAHKKKAAWRRACREQVKKGMINKADGTWISAGQADKNAMVGHMIAGYHFNR